MALLGTFGFMNAQATMISISEYCMYFRAYIHHSLTCDTSLDVYVEVNGDIMGIYTQADVPVCPGNKMYYIFCF